MDLEALVTVLDLIGTFAFALVGARIAADRGLDYGGIALVSAVASLAGGTLRNLFLGQRPPWVVHQYILATVLLAVIITIIAKSTEPVGRFVLSLDTLGLAVSTVSGAQFAIAHDAGIVATILLGVIGSITGGLLRDVLCQVPPVVLHRETIASACFAGASLYAICNYYSVDSTLNALVSAVTVVAVRELSIKFDINLPKVRR